MRVQAPTLELMLGYLSLLFPGPYLYEGAMGGGRFPLFAVVAHCTSRECCSTLERVRVRDIGQVLLLQLGLLRSSSSPSSTCSLWA